MTYDGVDIGEAIQPIQDRVETYQSNGYAVISPGDALSVGAYAVTVNSGNLDASDTLSVGSSSDEILFDGSVKSLSSSTNVRINSVSAAGDGTEQYRYDVIYADSSGEVNKTEGSVTKLDSRESQNNLTRFERFKAAIPNPGTDPSVIIAAVIVNSNDSSVGTGQLRDYRVPATTTANTIETENIDGGVTGNTTVSDIAGSGINIVSGSLEAQPTLGDGLDFAGGNIQMLDSIWDAANTELIADINNTTTVTDTLEANNISNDYLYSGAFSGNDADERLTNAISAASEGQCIFLESAEYSTNRTITKIIDIVGPNRKQVSAEISGVWTLQGVASSVRHLHITNEIVVEANNVLLEGLSSGDVTFDSSTSNGTIDSSVGIISVTDNGSNTVGDI